MKSIFRAVLMMLGYKALANNGENFRQKHNRPTSLLKSKVLDVGNSDKIVFYGVSSTESSLKAIGEEAGGMNYKAVGKAVERFGRRLKTGSRLAAQISRCLRDLSFVETRPPILQRDYFLKRRQV